MEIRFPCPSCKQPIEIDQEWASRAVACPYCRKTVTAPAESTLGPIDDIPMGRPLSVPSFPQTPSYGDAATPSPTPSGVLSVAALITACFMILMVIIASAIMVPHAAELMEVDQNSSTMGEKLQGMQRLMVSEDGSVPVWLMAAGMFSCASMLAWPAAVILGILGLYRSSRRNLAIIALVICGLFFIMNLAQFF